MKRRRVRIALGGKQARWEAEAHAHNTVCLHVSQRDPIVTQGASDAHGWIQARSLAGELGLGSESHLELDTSIDPDFEALAALLLGRHGAACMLQQRMFQSDRNIS